LHIQNKRPCCRAGKSNVATGAPAGYAERTNIRSCSFILMQHLSGLIAVDYFQLEQLD
jgi:hypothetical protein